MFTKNPIDKEQLERLKDLATHFEERKARASERLAQSVGNYWCFAVLGMHTDVDCFSFSQIGELRRIIEPPGEIELARALKNQHLFGAIGRYSHGITHELAVNREFADSDQAAFNLGW